VSVAPRCLAALARKCRLFQNVPGVTQRSRLVVPDHVQAVCPCVSLELREGGGRGFVRQKSETSL
jgi:hypothetical protein